ALTTTAGANTLDIQRQVRTFWVPPASEGTWKGEHPKDLALYVTATSDEGGKLVEFRDSNGTQGIGFGYNTIYATGSRPDQTLRLKARGTGRVEITQENWKQVGSPGEVNFEHSWGTSNQVPGPAACFFKDS